MISHLVRKNRRAKRVRVALGSRSCGRLRLSVFRSNKNIYAQIIDDTKGVTLASSSSLKCEATGSEQSKKLQQAAIVGAEIASKALAQGVKEVVFDRGPYLFHGRVKVLADAARESGLQF